MDNRKKKIKPVNVLLKNTELKKYDYFQSRKKLDSIMEELEEYKLKYESLDYITISSSGIIKFSTSAGGSKLSIQERFLNEKEFNLAKIFFDRLEYLTNKLLTVDERNYILYLYYDHIKSEDIKNAITLSDRQFSHIRQSAIIKTAIFFHCEVKK